MAAQASFGAIPSELLILIFSEFATPSLLPLAAVNHRFYSVVLRIFQQRLKRAISLPDHRLMLECYHPSEKLYTPYLYCDYLYTDSFDGLEAAAEGISRQTQPQTSSSSSDTTHPVNGLRGIYSHFRPVSEDEGQPRRASARRRLWRRSNTPANTTNTATNGGNGSGSNGSQAQHLTSQEAGPGRAEEMPRPTTDVYLDPDELFAQLCATTNVVRVGPRAGLFYSHVNVVDGLVRVFRDWLAAEAAATSSATTTTATTSDTAARRDDAGPDSPSILWTDAAHDVGLRFRVTERDIRGEHPVLVASEEELPVAYRLEFEELLVRSTTFLIMSERAEVEEVAAEGRAIVIASF